jgi:hypothetical protein
MEGEMDRPKVVVGLDVGAETFAAAALRSAGEVGEIKGSIANTAEGFDELGAWIDSISKLLIETDLPIFQITSLYNFTDAEHISRFFKKEKGMSMREYRKIHKSP